MKQALILFLMLFAGIATAQIPQTSWLRHPGGSYYDKVASIAITKTGELTIVGGWSDPAHFDGIKLDGNSEAEFIVAHYKSDGIPTWGQIGYSGHSRIGVSAVCVDDSGNIYVGGKYYYYLHIGSNAIGGDDDLFLAKFHPDSTLEWLVSYGSISGSAEIRALAPFPGGGVVVTGRGSGTLFGAQLITSNSPYVARFDASGNIVWYRIMRATGESEGDGIATDANGNVYLSGNFLGTFIDTTIQSNGAFVAKLDRNGNRMWYWGAMNTSGNSGFGYARNIGLDYRGHLYVTGYAFAGTRFGIDTIPGIEFDGGLFLAKFDTNGSPIWLRNSTHSDQTFDGAVALAVSPDGEPAIGGYFTNSLAMTGTTLTTNGGQDGFVARFTKDGSLRWIDQMGGVGDDQALALAFDSSGALYAGGGFAGGATIGGTTVTATALQDMFLLKYAPQASRISVQPPTSPVLSLSPNPTTARLFISGINTSDKIDIIDLMGRIVAVPSVGYSSEGKTIDVSSLVCGSYVVLVHTAESMISKRFSVIR